MPEISTIVFDLGGVMIDWNPRHLYKKIFEDEAKMEHFLEEICHPEWNQQQDAGRPFEQAVKELSSLHPHFAKEIHNYWERWPEMLGESIQEMVDLQTYFLNNSPYSVYALTNWSHQTMPFAKEKYDFLEKFEGMVVSGEERCVKPDPQIYHILFKRFKLKPQECVFIDDSFPNIVTARTLGMHGIHFQSPVQTKEELHSLEIEC